LKTRYRVVLLLKVDLDQHDSPENWMWPEVLDMDPDDVAVPEVREIGPAQAP